MYKIWYGLRVRISFAIGLQYTLWPSPRSNHHNFGSLNFEKWRSIVLPITETICFVSNQQFYFHRTFRIIETFIRQKRTRFYNVTYTFFPFIYHNKPILILLSAMYTSRNRVSEKWLLLHIFTYYWGFHQIAIHFSTSHLFFSQFIKKRILVW